MSPGPEAAAKPVVPCAVSASIEPVEAAFSACREFIFASAASADSLDGHNM